MDMAAGEEGDGVAAAAGEEGDAVAAVAGGGEEGDAVAVEAGAGEEGDEVAVAAGETEAICLGIGSKLDQQLNIYKSLHVHMYRVVEKYE
ncbi:hypothetical protein COP2_047016 [Malus domestica]